MTQQNKQVTRCMFCNSTSYGKGCPYSPHKRHVHITDGHKCIYCGSINVGSGCPYNPFNHIHVKGVEYNMMAKESIHRSVTAGLFLARLIQPIPDMPAFKMGLIDENGCKLKECVSDEEKAALTPTDMYILKIRRLIGEHVIDLFGSSVLLEINSKQQKPTFDANKYQDEVVLTCDINNAVDNLKDIFNESIEKGFSREYIENLIIQSILKHYDH